MAGERRITEASYAVAGSGQNTGRSHERVQRQRRGSQRRLTQLDWFDVLVFLALAGVAIWIMSVLIWRARSGDLIWSGTDGPYLGDQMQYLGWIRDAAKDVVIGNPFILGDSEQGFVHPGLVISGVLHRMGMAPAVAYLVWKPVAVVALFAAFRTYVYRMLVGTAQRRVALVLALLVISPVWAIVDWLNLVDHGLSDGDVIYLRAMVFDMWPGLYLWGYPFTALAVAAMVACFLVYARDRSSARVRLWAPLLALTCAWLQPWQGATVVAVLLGTEVVLWRRERSTPVRLLVTTVAATAVPLGYYAVLSRVDASWTLAGEVNRWDAGPVWVPFACVAPFLLFVVLAYRLPSRDFQDVAVRIWLPAGLLIYWFIAYSGLGTFPLHALQGLSVPLAVLTVAGAAPLRFPRVPAARTGLAILAVGAITVPALVDELWDMRQSVLAGREPYLLRAGERQALDYLQDEPSPGGVLAPVYLGQTVPALTGRQTWVGIVSWTPSYSQRVFRANALFTGQLSPSARRRFVLSTGAHFLLSDCRRNKDLTADLQPILVSVQRFGCATVYRVDPSS